jgi:outer membrane protein assembly factor BamB
VVPGVDQARTNAVQGPRSGIRLDTSHFAWTMARKSAILYPPAGTLGLLVLAEDDGTVSAVDPGTGAVAWQLQLEGPIVAPPVIAHGLVFVADSSKSLFALDAGTGTARWVASFGDLVSTAPVVSDDAAIAATEDGVLHEIGLRAGRELRTADVADVVTTPPALVGSLLVVADRSGGVTAFTLPRLNRAWSSRLTDTLSAGPVVADGLVVVAQTGGQLSAFAVEDGTLQWRAASPGDLPGPPAVASGTVVEVAGHFVVGRNLDDGHERWRQRIGPQVSAPPMIVGQQVVVVDDEATIHTFALSNGALGPERTLPAPDPATRIDTELPMSFVQGSLVVPSHNNGPWPFTIMYAFPTETAGIRRPDTGVLLSGEIRDVPTAPVTAPTLLDGHLLMAGAFPAGVYDVPPSGPAKTLLRSSSSVVSATLAGDLVLAQAGNDLEAVPRTGGSPRWRFPMGPPSPAQRPVVAGTVAVVPIFGKGLVGLDIGTGRVAWSRTFGGSVGRSSPLLLPDGNVAYAVGGLTVLDPTTGRVLWRVPDVNAFAPIASDEGSIFAEVLTSRGSVLAAVDAATGGVRWAKPFEVTIDTGPAARDGVVAAVDSANVLTVFDEATGARLWAVALRTAPNGDPVVVDGRVAVQEQGRIENIQQRDFRLSVWDARTGRLEAQWELPGSGFTRAGFGVSGDTLLAPGISSQSAIFLLRMRTR